MSKNDSRRSPGIAVVSALPTAGAAHSGVAYYAADLADALAASADLDVVALANENSSANLRAAHLERVWKSGALYPFAVARAVRAKRISTVLVEHTPFLYGGGAAGIFAFSLLLALLRASGCRVVTDLHDIRPLRTIDKAFVKSIGLPVPAGLLRLAFRALFGSIARLSHRVVVHDPSAARTIVADYGARANCVNTIALLPPSVALTERSGARGALSIPNGTRCLLFFGYASSYKGLELLSGALNMLDAHGGPDNLLVLIGAGPNPHLAENAEYRAYYEDIKRKLSANRHVRWHGFIGDDEVGTYFAAADAIILPYTRTIGSSYPLAQAVAYGCPALVSTSIPSEGYDAEIVRFEPTVEAIAAAIAQFADGPTSTQARRSGEKSTAMIIAQYRSALAA